MIILRGQRRLSCSLLPATSRDGRTSGQATVARLARGSQIAHENGFAATACGFKAALGFQFVTRARYHSFMDSVRIDKWLWAARFFKTRALASKACDLGRVLYNGLRAKPAREVKVGDRLRIENEGGIWEIDVLLLNEMRGPSAVAQTLYLETEAGRAQRLLVAAEKKAMAALLPLPEHRPSKRDRRRIIQFRGRGA